MGRLKSRKFWMAVVGGACLILKEGLGLQINTETITAFAAIILGYILVEGAADVKSR